MSYNTLNIILHSHYIYQNIDRILEILDEFLVRK